MCSEDMAGNVARERAWSTGQGGARSHPQTLEHCWGLVSLPPPPTPANDSQQQTGGHRENQSKETNDGTMGKKYPRNRPDTVSTSPKSREQRSLPEAQAEGPGKKSAGQSPARPEKAGVESAQPRASLAANHKASAPVQPKIKSQTRCKTP